MPCYDCMTENVIESVYESVLCALVLGKPIALFTPVSTAHVFNTKTELVLFCTYIRLYRSFHVNSNS